jgi:hypothetical protein
MNYVYLTTPKKINLFKLSGYKLTFLSLLLLFVFCRKAEAQVTEVFVSPKGDDKDTGSQLKPFKTVNKALAVIHRYANKNVNIQLRGGTYYLDQTIEINAANNLPARLQITAYSHERVYISAGRRLFLDWKPYRDGIYQAAVPIGISFERLFINGVAQILARYPNYDPAARVYHGTSADAIAPERIKLWKNPAGGYVHALHSGEWGSFDYLIKGVDNKYDLQMTGGWQNNRPADINKQFRFVENIFEELDAPGEWYLDNVHLLSGKRFEPFKGVS